MSRILAASVLAVLLAGCAGTVPFDRAVPVSTDAADPQTVVSGFQAALPERFHLLSSIVFEYNWFTVAGIGYLELNRTDGTYKVSCMNHMGVKLFEFAGDRSGLTSQYAIGPLAQQGNLTAAVAEDIRRIYLDQVPGAGARVQRRDKSILFRQQAGDGALEYEFSGEGMHLTRKTYREDNRAVWRVSYYEYREKNGSFYPMGIIFTHLQHGYRLVVRQKEILD